jgi:hypothetical protein
MPSILAKLKGAHYPPLIQWNLFSVGNPKADGVGFNLNQSIFKGG